VTISSSLFRLLSTKADSGLAVIEKPEVEQMNPINGSERK
jgi:hypothetical protein